MKYNKEVLKMASTNGIIKNVTEQLSKDYKIPLSTAYERFIKTQVYKELICGELPLYLLSWQETYL